MRLELNSDLALRWLSTDPYVVWKILEGGVMEARMLEATKSFKTLQ